MHSATKARPQYSHKPEPATQLAPLAGKSGGRSFRDLLIGRLRIHMPVGMPLADFTREYPGAVFRVMDRVPVGDGKTIIIRFEVDNLDPNIVERRLYTNASVAEVWLAAAGPGHRSFVVRIFNPPYIPTLERFEVLRWLPITIQDGCADWTVLCPRSAWKPFVADLRSRVDGVDVLAVGVQSSLRDPEGPLTRRQAQVYRQAVLEGYYEIPRRISMSDLAKKLHCSKSTICEVLARAERKMLRTDQFAAPAPLVPVPETPRRRRRATTGPLLAP